MTEREQVTTAALLGGFKADEGKPRFDLLAPRALLALATLFGIGAKKYAARNWEKGMLYGRVFRAMMSHAWKWWNGEEYDQVDGQHHLDSVMWCAMVLREYQFYAADAPEWSARFDDRWFTALSRAEPPASEAKPTQGVAVGDGSSITIKTRDEGADWVVTHWGPLA